MNDLVQRLRQHDGMLGVLVEEAADEIERLRELLTAARALLQHHKAEYPDEIDDALADRSRAGNAAHAAADVTERQLRAELERALDDNARLRRDTDRLIHEIERLQADNTALQERNAELYRARAALAIGAAFLLEQTDENCIAFEKALTEAAFLPHGADEQPEPLRTCATCHAVLAPGPQPAATYEQKERP